MKKTCSKCKRILLLTEFYKNRTRRDGLQHKCKACNNKRKRAWKAVNEERYLLYQKKYRETHREKGHKYSREYRKNHPEKFCAYHRKWDACHPKQRKARNAVSNAILHGKLTRPAAYPSCGAEVFIEAHHKDYQDPLEIVWLYHGCHRKLHKEKNVQNRSLLYNSLVRCSRT